ncbi:MAG: hypothetical protein AAFY08_00265 [Planctomycetota bacterium]
MTYKRYSLRNERMARIKQIIRDEITSELKQINTGKKDLSNYEKWYIAKFVVSLLTPPALLLSVATFAIGFYFQHAIYDDAYSDAYLAATEKANETVLETRTTAIELDLEVQKAKKELEEIGKLVKVTEGDINNLKKRAEAGVEAIFGVDVDAFADIVAETPQIRSMQQDIRSVVLDEVSRSVAKTTLEMNSKIAALEDNTTKASMTIADLKFATEASGEKIGVVSSQIDKLFRGEASLPKLKIGDYVWIGANEQSGGFLTILGTQGNRAVSLTSQDGDGRISVAYRSGSPAIEIGPGGNPQRSIIELSNLSGDTSVQIDGSAEPGFSVYRADGNRIAYLGDYEIPHAIGDGSTIHPALRLKHSQGQYENLIAELSPGRKWPAKADDFRSRLLEPIQIPSQ